jgi:hypothetical protein
VLSLFAVALAVLIEFVVKPEFADPRVQSLLSTISTSLFAALFLGITFEVLLSNLRAGTFRDLFEEHRRIVFQRIDTLTLFSTEELFELLRSITQQTTQLPTLYETPRRPAEYTFAGSLDFFEALVESRRGEVSKILRSWIRADSHSHVKFLASDFIGYFHFADLSRDLLGEGRRALADLERANNEEGSIGADEAWILNYIWAASRCESSVYSTLGRLLHDTESAAIQYWILFVPRQMPHDKFFGMIANYLDRAIEHGKTISDTNLKEAVVTLSHLVRSELRPRDQRARKILDKRSKFVEARNLGPIIEEAWQGLDPKTKPRVGNEA